MLKPGRLRPEQPRVQTAPDPRAWQAQVSTAHDTVHNHGSVFTLYPQELDMIREMAHITVKPGTQPDFEAGVRQALPLFHRARGCTRVELHHIIEKPEQYVLMVYWETLDDHMVHFRQSEDFQAWRGLVGGFFEKAPEVVHSEVVVE